MKLEGTVQMDGKYAGGHIKPENKAEDRIDRRLKQHQNMKRLCVLALREKNDSGFERTFTRIVREEQGDAAWSALKHHVDRSATVVTDEHTSYADLTGLNDHKQVNHSEAYRTKDGTNTNHVESFFSRIQRGICRHPSPLFAEVLRLVCCRTRLARGQQAYEQWQIHGHCTGHGDVGPHIAELLWLLAAKQPPRSGVR